MSGYDCRNKWVFSFRRNVVSDGADWTSTGRLFQSRGPAAANERSPTVTRLRNVYMHCALYAMALSVYLSVTRRYIIETVARIISQSTHRPLIRTMSRRIATFRRPWVTFKATSHTARLFECDFCAAVQRVSITVADGNAIFTVHRSESSYMPDSKTIFNLSSRGPSATTESLVYM